MTPEERFNQFGLQGFAPYYDSNGRFMGYLIVMGSYINNIYYHGFYSRENGRCLIINGLTCFTNPLDGPNGIKYCFEHKTEFGDIYYIGAITKDLVVTI